MKKSINIFIGIFAAVTLVNYTVYFIHQLIFPEQTQALVITLLVIAAVVLPVIFRKALKRLLKRAYPVCKAVWGAGLIFYVISFSVMTAVIFSSSSKEVAPSELPDKTVIVIYGAKIGGTAEDPRPGRFLEFRLKRAAEIMSEAPDSVCIVCGGKGDNEPCAEALVMRDRLVSLGVDPSRIFVDDESKNTLENIENAKRIITENGLEDHSVACLSTRFHIPRIKLLCKKAGLDAEYFFSADSPNVFGLWSSLVREYMSYGKLVLTGRM